MAIYVNCQTSRKKRLADFLLFFTSGGFAGVNVPSPFPKRIETSSLTVLTTAKSKKSVGGVGGVSGRIVDVTCLFSLSLLTIQSKPLLCLLLLYLSS